VLDEQHRDVLGQSARTLNSMALSSFGTPAAGSSSSSTFGRVASASAISSSRCWP
jgi:hypothetical protein